MARGAVLLLLVLTLGCASSSHAAQGVGSPDPSASPAAPSDPGHLQAGSNPSALPGPILIADRNNNRLLEVDPSGRVVWQFPPPGGLGPGQTFRSPDDGFFTPDGKHVIATEESRYAIGLIDVATGKLVWRYGQPGQPGSGPNRLWNPDDALALPNGDVLVADIKNCRLLLVPAGGHAPQKIFGETDSSCAHDPPRRWGSPNGAFPMRNGQYLVTEINGDWVDELDLNGVVSFSLHPPGVQYPSDTNEVSPGRYLTVDYSQPGQIVLFDRSGKALWRYGPTGAAALNHPSLALPLPNGDILCNDDFNDRVIVVDPRTNKVVWQYGETAHPGSAPGLLNNPDGVDLAPPHSLLMTHASTMGLPPPHP